MRRRCRRASRATWTSLRPYRFQSGLRSNPLYSRWGWSGQRAPHTTSLPRQRPSRPTRTLLPATTRPSPSTRALRSATSSAFVTRTTRAESSSPSGSSQRALTESHSLSSPPRSTESSSRAPSSSTTSPRQTKPSLAFVPKMPSSRQKLSPPPAPGCPPFSLPTT